MPSAKFGGTLRAARCDGPDPACGGLQDDICCCVLSREQCTDRHEGVYGFYRGLIPGIIRVLPATWITFVVYEEMSHLFKLYAT